MSRLLLLKHSLPVINSRVPAAQWPLSDDGVRRCETLARQMTVYNPEKVISSREVKAQQTARLVAERLSVPWQVVDDLHEHKRPLPGLATQEDFDLQVQEFFSYPDQLVFGVETARQAQSRFCQAVEKSVDSHTGQTLAIVAHGTVISLFVAEKNDTAAFPFWKRLGLPSLVVLTLPDYKLEKVIENVN